MKKREDTITANRFLSKFLGVNVGYSEKKLTHIKIEEIIRNRGLECILLNNKNREELVNLSEKDLLIVADQTGRKKTYINPFCLSDEYTNNKYYPIPTQYEIEHEIRKVKLALLQARKRQILKDFSQISEIYNDYNELLNHYNELVDSLKIIIELKTMTDKIYRPEKRKSNQKKYIKMRSKPKMTPYKRPQTNWDII